MVGIRCIRAGLVLGLAALALPVGLTNANAVSVVADWEMNDDSATVLVDNSGQGHNGVIAAGAADDGLHTNQTFGPDVIGYHWDNVKPNVDIVPDRVVRISDAAGISDPALNPGSHNWKISFRYRTTRPFGNIMQKGQSQAKGGQIKFQLPKGQISCMYKSSTGVRRSIKTVNRYDNGNWYVVRCERLTSGVTLRVYNGTDTNEDPANLLETRHINGSSGTINNTVPMTIGGKPNCNQMDITCDYFAGDIDWVKVEDLS